MAPKIVSTAPEPIEPVSGLGGSIPFSPKKPDYLHWKRLDLWTLGQAVCLICNCDPEQLKSKSHPLRDSYRYKDDNKANELRRFYQLAITSIKVGALKIWTSYNHDLFKEVLPREFIEWAKSKGLSIPDELGDFPGDEAEVLMAQSNLTKGSVRKKALRPDQKARDQCREIAKSLWDKDPSITIASMTDHPNMIDSTKKNNGSFYTEKTIRNWIKNLCPDRSKGRRKKKV